jgi:hypothetical protein
VGDCVCDDYSSALGSATHGARGREAAAKRAGPDPSPGMGVLARRFFSGQSGQSIAEPSGSHLNELLVVALLLISTVSLYAQRQQQNVAKLKDDARNLVGIIGSDNAKIQTYCQIEDLSEQLIEAAQEGDRKKAKALERKIAELNKKMGPEFAALVDIEKHVDLDSRDGQEIASIVASLGESCGEGSDSPGQ